MIVESSSWVYFELNAISNYPDQLKILNVEKSEEEDCFIRNIKGVMTSDSAEEIYEQLRHYYGDCDDVECKYCEICGEDEDCMEIEDH